MSAMAKRKDPGPEAQRSWQDFVDEVRSRTEILDVVRRLSPSSNVQDKQRTSSNRRSFFLACCPFHADDTASMSLLPTTQRYNCFGCGAEGDAFKFIMELNGVGFGNAVRTAADIAGVSIPSSFHAPDSAGPRPFFRPAPEPKPLRPFVLPPADAHIAETGSWIKAWSISDGKMSSFNPAAVHVYRDADQRLLCQVLRLEGKKGKSFRPLTWADPAASTGDDVELLAGMKESGWVLRGTPGPLRPVYGADRVAGLDPANFKGLLVVEGEKSADKSQVLLDGTGWIVLSPMGGLNAVSAMDFEPIAKAIEQRLGKSHAFDIVAWPDADELIHRNDGSVMDRVATFQDGVTMAARAFFKEWEAVRFLRITPPDGKTDGWDAADAVEDGWTREEMLTLIVSAEGGPSKEQNIGASMNTTNAALRLQKPDEKNAPADASDAAAPWEDPDPVANGDLPAAADATHLSVVQPHPATPGADHEDADMENHIPDVDDSGDDDADEIPIAETLENYFRCLGFDQDRFYYFQVKESNQIVGLRPREMVENNLISLAPLEVWTITFGRVDRKGRETVDLSLAVNYLIRRCHDAGIWSRSRCVLPGARLDNEHVVFHFGSALWVEGVGLMDPYRHTGRYVYSSDEDMGAPNFDNPLGPASGPHGLTDPACEDELGQLLKIIRSIAWRRADAALSQLGMLGWLAIAPICGVLPWRPHLWLDGPSGSGKSWLMNNIFHPILGSYALHVTSNTTESGVRNAIMGRTIPVMFDEAEGENTAGRTRMDAILRLARQASNDSMATVVQGVQGGGGTRSTRIETTMMFTSIMPQLTASADISRFARLHLAGPSAALTNQQFNDLLVIPSARLFTPEFSRRFVARMILHANLLRRTQKIFVEAMANMGILQRHADVYGSLAAGAWLLLNDGEIADAGEAILWLTDMGVQTAIIDIAQASLEDQEYSRMVSVILASQIRVESQGQSYTMFETIGNLIAAGMQLNHGEDGLTINPQAAAEALMRYGIKLHPRHGPICNEEHPPGLVFHNHWKPLADLLKDTRYAGRDYDGVLMQVPGAAKTKSPVRFGAMGTSRGVFLPIDRILPGIEIPNDE